MKNAGLTISAVLAIVVMMYSPQAVAATAIRVPATRVFGCSVSRDPSTSEFPVPTGAVPLSLAMADFTGDTHPDLARLELDRLDSSQAHYFIEIQLTEGGRQSLELTAPARTVFLTPMDVTGDGTLDLVVRTEGSEIPVAVFLNNGCGHFSVNQATRFASVIQGVPAGPNFCACDLRYESAAVARGPNAADPGELPRSFLHVYINSPLPTHHGAPAELFLPLRTDRAPPLTV